MTNDWVEKEIDDVAEVIGGGTPSTKDESNFGGDIAWITPKDLSGYSSRYISRGERNITEKGLRNSSARLLPKGSVLLTTRAPVGYLAISANPVTTNQGFHSLVPKTGYDAEFIYYLLKANVEILKSHSTGTTFGELTGSVLRRLRFCFPAYKEQRAIAHILGTLDDKIELNRQMNATLEAIARALFKSWFVDFDPVRAKAEGRQPAGMDAETAALFPAAFVDSELGEIPKGWRVAKLGELGQVICGKTPSTIDKDNYGGNIPFITIPDMHERVFVTRTGKTLSAKGASSQSSKTLPAFSICVSCIATPGLVAITSEPSQTNQQINSLVPNDRQSIYYWYYTLKGLADQIKVRGSGGSVVTNLNKSQFEMLSAIAAPDELQQHYQKTVEPLFLRLLSNEHESETLAALRDALLPKLISGEIRIKDAVRLIPRI